MVDTYICKFQTTVIGLVRGFPTLNYCYLRMEAVQDMPPHPRRRSTSLSLSLSATGWASIGRPISSPALSLRGQRLRALSGPPSEERMREGAFPPLAVPVADDGGITLVTSDCAELFVPDCVLPSDVARGRDWGPLTLARDRVSVPADT